MFHLSLLVDELKGILRRKVILSQQAVMHGRGQMNM